MRTTLDIDDDVLEAVRERARDEKKSIGAVLSELARIAILGPEDNAMTGRHKGFGEAPQAGFTTPLPTFPPTPRKPGEPRRIATSALVRRLLDEADWEDGQVNDFTKHEGASS